MSLFKSKITSKKVRKEYNYISKKYNLNYHRESSITQGFFAAIGILILIIFLVFGGDDLILDLIS